MPQDEHITTSRIGIEKDEAAQTDAVVGLVCGPGLTLDPEQKRSDLSLSILHSAHALKQA